MLTGLLSGTALGLFLKGMQSLTGIKVYVLLLNVDFIPILGSNPLPEWFEFLLHLLVSCGIGIIFVSLVKRFQLSAKGAVILAFLLTLPTVFLYFPLSYLAIKEVPSLMDGKAIVLWSFGHILYALTLQPIYSTLQKKTFDT
ncbi:hypothetical protein KH172YL63_13380 [Bacillus sp. KH172YL63]|nr:hypothetical protein KH172YL63_13380 [Bacillus sp. KH172YL63]